MAILMASPFHMLLVCLSLALPLSTIQGLSYSVKNNASTTRGGRLFDRSMGVERTQNSMKAAAYFIWQRVFYQEKESDRKQVGEISLVIQSEMNLRAFFKEQHILNQEVYEIHIAAKHIEDCIPEALRSVRTKMQIEDIVRSKIDWILTFGVAYALQWTANGAIPQALRTGIAGFAVLEAHYTPKDWVKAGEGNIWNQSTDIAAQFFYYISKRKYQFVANLNKMMRTSYRDSYFEEAAGKTIDEWWAIYKGDNHQA